MAAQRMTRQRGLATLAVTGMLTLLALGAALASLRMAADRAADAAQRRMQQRLENRLDAALRHMTRTPDAIDRLRKRARGGRAEAFWPNRAYPELRIHLDFRHGPNQVQVRIEPHENAGSDRAIRVRLRRVDGRWRIVPWSWHDFAP